MIEDYPLRIFLFRLLSSLAKLQAVAALTRMKFWCLEMWVFRKFLQQKKLLLKCKIPPCDSEHDGNTIRHHFMAFGSHNIGTIQATGLKKAAAMIGLRNSASQIFGMFP